MLSRASREGAISLLVCFDRDAKGLEGIVPRDAKDQEGAGISGNREPWVVGGSAVSSTPGRDDVLSYPFVGAIDELRFYNERIIPSP